MVSEKWEEGSDGARVPGSDLVDALDAAAHAELVWVAKGVGQESAGDATIDRRGDGELGCLHYARVDNVQSRAVAVASTERHEGGSEGVDVAVDTAKDGVILDVHGARVQPCAKGLHLEQERLSGLK